MATNNSFSNRHFYYHSSDIAKCLQELCFDKDSTFDNDSTNITIKDKDKYFDELENAIYNLHCIAANEHNLDCYRVLYETLVELTERVDRHLVGEINANIR